MEKNYSNNYINEYIEADTKNRTNMQLLPKEIIYEKDIKMECKIDFKPKEDIEVKLIEIENKEEEEINPELNLNQKSNEVYPLEKISKTFKENEDLKQFAKYVEDKGKIKENIWKKIENIPTKRARCTKEQMIQKRELNERNKEMKISRKFGRKHKRDCSDRAHNKFLDDNILKKIKSKFLRYLILFVNEVIKGENVINKNKFKFLNYKYTDCLKKSEEIKLLNMTIKGIILNKSISPKYSKPDKDYNKKLLEIILQKENSNEIINYVFNMKFKEWIDILTKKVKAKIKEEYFNQIGDLLKRVVEKNDDNDNDEYMPNFIYCLYNYERLFILKRAKCNEVNEKDEE